ncbi:hypothetical protein O3G_MSEX003510 [Manduca sexta]|uniref:Uncharacterized protein n=1 Tax=Manduca sexta TaxID=7130 RepID=A0A921YT00_MANSE|nr:hypothetical protein O3G_MSEX003510 [Manduca sexta]
MQKLTNERKNKLKKLRAIQKNAIKSGVNWSLLKQYNLICSFNRETNIKGSNKSLILSIIIAFILLVISVIVSNVFLSVRCILPNNFLVWEATRPVADCVYCQNVTRPVILWDVTRRNFANYSYSSKPIIVKNAIKHWRATKEFSFNMFRKLYEGTAGSYESLEDGCQFLNFKSDLFSLQEVFNMPEARARNAPGQEPWYVGWGNCHPDILSKVRQYYDVPEFLPEDAEYPATENIFFGYEIGAVMHLDYIPRLMWQGQVRGNKTWTIAPVPECDHVCKTIEFYVEPGDVGELVKMFLYVV